MQAANPTLAELDPWERIDRMPDHRPLKSSEAAIFMTLSLSTLERMRVAGTGPDYFQGGMPVDGSIPKPAVGTNQHVRYFKEDIKKWQQAHKVSSSMQAAIRKGQMFATIFDLGQQEAFYLDAQGNLDGMVENTPISTVIERLNTWDIVWLNAVEAASRRWSNLAAHQSFADSVKRVLSNASHAIDAGLEGTEIAESLRKGA